jgi:hypothetical protein
MVDVIGVFSLLLVLFLLLIKDNCLIVDISYILDCNIGYDLTVYLLDDNDFNID